MKQACTAQEILQRIAEEPHAMPVVDYTMLTADPPTDFFGPSIAPFLEVRGPAAKRIDLQTTVVTGVMMVDAIVGAVVIDVGGPGADVFVQEYEAVFGTEAKYKLAAGRTVIRPIEPGTVLASLKRGDAIPFQFKRKPFPPSSRLAIDPYVGPVALGVAIRGVEVTPKMCAEILALSGQTL